MDNIEKKCEHRLLVNATREKIKEGDSGGKCVDCFESIKVDRPRTVGDSYQVICGYLFCKKDEDILKKIRYLQN